MANTIYTSDDITCFISDNETKSIIDLVLERLGLNGARVIKGDVNDAVDHFRKAAYTRIIIVDCKDEDLIISKVETLFSVCGPDAVIVVIGDRNEVSIFRDLIKINVHDYLVKPLNVDVVTRLLTSILTGEEQRKRSGKIIGFLGATGGCGCSTIALNTACVLSNEMAKKVLLVDMDLQFGTIPIKLDIKSSHGLREAMESPDTIDDTFIEQFITTYGEHLKILSSEEPLYEYFALDNQTYVRNFETLLDVLSARYHYILFDLSRHQTPLWRAVGKRADHFFVVTNLNLVGLRDTIRITTALNEDYARSDRQFIINSISDHNSLQADRFEKSIGERAAATITYESSAVTAANLGIPLVKHTSKYRKMLQPLVDLIIGNSSVPTKDETVFKKLLSMIKP